MHYICSTFVPQLAHIICLSQENMPTAQGHNSGAIMYIICSDLLKKKKTTSKHGLKIVVSLLLCQSFIFDVDSSAINTTSCTRPISFSVQITFLRVSQVTNNLWSDWAMSPLRRNCQSVRFSVTCIGSVLDTLSTCFNYWSTPLSCYLQERMRSTIKHRLCYRCKSPRSKLSEIEVLHNLLALFHWLAAVFSAPEGGSDGGEWRTVSGRFLAINTFLISCRCRFSAQGPSPCAHLGDGCFDIVLVHESSRTNYFKHLYRCTKHDKDQVSRLYSPRSPCTVASQMKRQYYLLLHVAPGIFSKCM